MGLRHQLSGGPRGQQGDRGLTRLPAAGRRSRAFLWQPHGSSGPRPRLPLSPSLTFVVATPALGAPSKIPNTCLPLSFRPCCPLVWNSLLSHIYVAAPLLASGLCLSSVSSERHLQTTLDKMAFSAFSERLTFFTFFHRIFYYMTLFVCLWHFTGM